MTWKNEFGWLPIRVDCSGPRFRITTSPHFEEAVREIVSSGQTDEDWFWPPLQSESPPIPAPVFALETTHEIEVDLDNYSKAQQLGEFVVTVLGFMYGVLLTPGSWVNFYRVCIKPSRWQDFYVRETAQTRVLCIAADKWLNSPSVRDELFGVFRWHTFALDDHPFEIFMMQYMVTDACWKLHTKLHAGAVAAGGHAGRIEELARFYDLQIPTTWRKSEGSLAVTDLRNKLIHEARWGNAPVGFGQPEQPNETIHLDLIWFNSRLLLAMIGDRSDYTRSPFTVGYQLLR